MPSPLLSPTNAGRWAAAPTVVMALANVPAAFQPDDFDLPAAVLWLFTAVGVAGLAAAVLLVLRHPIAPPAVAAIGAVNVIGGLAALVGGDGAGVVGLVLGGAALALLLVPAWRRSRRAAGAAPAGI